MRNLLARALEILRPAPGPGEIAVLPPRYRVQVVGSRLSDVCPTPGELEATEALLEATRALLSHSTTTERTER